MIFILRCCFVPCYHASLAVDKRPAPNLRLELRGRVHRGSSYKAALARLAKPLRSISPKTTTDTENSATSQPDSWSAALPSTPGLLTDDTCAKAVAHADWPAIYTGGGGP